MSLCVIIYFKKLSLNFSDNYVTKIFIFNVLHNIPLMHYEKKNKVKYILIWVEFKLSTQSKSVNRK